MCDLDLEQGSLGVARKFASFSNGRRGAGPPKSSAGVPAEFPASGDGLFGVEEFPDLEAVQRHGQMLTDLNWARYMESRTTLGTELTLPQ